MNQKDIDKVLNILYKIRDGEEISKSELDDIILELEMASVSAEMEEYGEFDE